MPPTPARNAPFFTERLHVPGRWWAIAAVGVAVGGAEVIGGFDWRVAAVVYAVLGIPTLVLLIGLSRTTITVDADGLHAGGRTLPLSEVTAARTLDARETRHMLGPGGHPAGHVAGRGYVKTAVLIRPADEETTPYWLVTTRRPDELVTVLEQAVRT
jgi:hypothetical protein